jgi:ADP-dependent NAD(P)H-hydrate dehydratase
VVITPHAGEMARLWGIPREEVERRAATLAVEAAQALDVVVVLKGPTTYIAAPDGRCLCNTAGNLGLGTSGSGDVLAGIIAGLCARGAEPFQAAAWGVFGHARAGERLARRVAPLGFLARELLEEVPSVLHSLR